MLIVKRIKGVMTHYATAVTPSGRVDTWTTNASEAVPIPSALGKKVEAHYATRPDAGTISFGHVEGSGDETVVLPDEQAAAVAEELVALRAQLADEVRENGELKDTIARMTEKLRIEREEQDVLRANNEMLVGETTRLATELAAAEAMLNEGKEVAGE